MSDDYVRAEVEQSDPRPGGREIYVPLRIDADAARDARVAARRAEDARRAGLALDRLLTDGRKRWWDESYREGFISGFAEGYAASGLHHNRHYGVPVCACADPEGQSGCPVHGDAWADAWPDGAV
jgi:hypothetical protein